MGKWPVSPGFDLHYDLRAATSLLDTNVVLELSQDRLASQ